MRPKIKCSRCNQTKGHFGLGMCSACLRRTKRETKPEFYLGTCYSEMTRRVKTYDPKRPRYFNLSICNRDEFKEKFKKDPQFLKLYKNWQSHGFKRKHAPSIDHINNEKGYTLDNLEFTSHYENSVKDQRNKCYARCLTTGIMHSFKSQLDMSKFFNSHPSTICLKLKRSKSKFKGYEIWR